ncbi:MAG: CpsB/CapC family capsule biosynthesis tyrosine phosphatase [Pseudomonadota bacterium]
MIDLHCHLLPGIDDGPDTMEESLELCRIALADGITRAITTPHIHPGRWSNTRKSIQRDCFALSDELRKNNIPLQLGFAAEVRLTDQLMNQIANDEIPFYGQVDGFNIMLLEFPHGQVIPGSEKLAQWLLNQKVRPLIAHPERNRQLMRNVDGLQPFIELGCWLQITAGSLLGDFGDRAQALALRLLEIEAVTVIASDGHNDKARPPRLRAAFDLVAQHHGLETAVRLTEAMPARISAQQFA